MVMVGVPLLMQWGLGLVLSLLDGWRKNYGAGKRQYCG